MEPSGAAGVISLLPLLIISLVSVVVAVPLAKRKGKSQWVFGILSIIPAIGWYTLVYLVGITDEEVYKRLGRIEEKLGARS